MVDLTSTDTDTAIRQAISILEAIPKVDDFDGEYVICDGDDLLEVVLEQKEMTREGYDECVKALRKAVGPMLRCSS